MDTNTIRADVKIEGEKVTIALNSNTPNLLHISTAGISGWGVEGRFKSCNRAYKKQQE